MGANQQKALEDEKDSGPGSSNTASNAAKTLFDIASYATGIVKLKGMFKMRKGRGSIRTEIEEKEEFRVAYKLFRDNLNLNEMGLNRVFEDFMNKYDQLGEISLRGNCLSTLKHTGLSKCENIFKISLDDNGITDILDLPELLVLVNPEAEKKMSEFHKAVGTFLGDQRVPKQSLFTLRNKLELGAFRTVQSRFLNETRNEIVMNENAVYDFPEFAKARRKGLHSISFKMNEITKLSSEALAQLKNCLHLDFNLNKINEIHDEINNITCLVELNLSNNELINIPDMSKLQRLAYLSLANNKISFYYDGFLEKNTGLRLLDLSSNRIRNIPPGINKCVLLAGFSMKDNRVMNIRAFSKIAMKELINLKYLDLSNNELSMNKMIWNNMNNMRSLTWLDIRGNFIFIPETMQMNSNAKEILNQIRKQLLSTRKRVKGNTSKKKIEHINMDDQLNRMMFPTDESRKSYGLREDVSHLPVTANYCDEEKRRHKRIIALTLKKDIQETKLYMEKILNKMYRPTEDESFSSIFNDYLTIKRAKHTDKKEDSTYSFSPPSQPPESEGEDEGESKALKGWRAIRANTKGKGRKKDIRRGFRETIGFRMMSLFMDTHKLEKLDLD